MLERTSETLFFFPLITDSPELNRLSRLYLEFFSLYLPSHNCWMMIWIQLQANCYLQLLDYHCCDEKYQISQLSQSTLVRTLIMTIFKFNIICGRGVSLFFFMHIHDGHIQRFCTACYKPLPHRKKSNIFTFFQHKSPYGVLNRLICTV